MWTSMEGGGQGAGRGEGGGWGCSEFMWRNTRLNVSFDSFLRKVDNSSCGKRVSVFTRTHARAHVHTHTHTHKLRAQRATRSRRKNGKNNNCTVRFYSLLKTLEQTIYKINITYLSNGFRNTPKNFFLAQRSLSSNITKRIGPVWSNDSSRERFTTNISIHFYTRTEENEQVVSALSRSTS